MLLSKAAFDILVSPDNQPMGETNPADFPSAIVFQQSECKTQLLYLSEFLSIVILLPVEGVREGSINVSFKRRLLSNFVGVKGPGVTINDTPVKSFKCPEQFFKAACVVFHIETDPVNAPESLVENRLSVLRAIMNAATPQQAKFATGGLTGLQPFYAREWDEVSFEVMIEAQIWKATDPDCHAFHHYLADLCSEHGILFDHVYFFEALGKRDVVWGTGLDVDEMHAATVSLPDARWGAPDCDEVPDESRPFPGKNKLGRAIQTAFLFVVGDDGEFVAETAEAFVERVGTASGTFEFEPVKRARTASAE
jgi:predicted NAD-dependent protein-ADP-ribosyltransferase YbiA (DUF1768 family)